MGSGRVFLLAVVAYLLGLSKGDGFRLFCLRVNASAGERNANCISPLTTFHNFASASGAATAYYQP